MLRAGRDLIRIPVHTIQSPTRPILPVPVCIPPFPSAPVPPVPASVASLPPLSAHGPTHHCPNCRLCFDACLPMFSDLQFSRATLWHFLQPRRLSGGKVLTRHSPPGRGVNLDAGRRALLGDGAVSAGKNRYGKGHATSVTANMLQLIRVANEM